MTPFERHLEFCRYLEASGSCPEIDKEVFAKSLRLLEECEKKIELVLKGVKKV